MQQQWSAGSTTLHRATDRPLAVANGRSLLLTRPGYDRCGGPVVAGEVLRTSPWLRQGVSHEGWSPTRLPWLGAPAYTDDAAVVEGYTKSLARFSAGTRLVVTTALAAVGT